jgi:hypothetical protein
MVFCVKAHTPTDLQSAIYDDLVWRRREMSPLITLIQSVGYVDQRAVVRASVPLLYAHWEGVSKYSAQRYLEFVSFRRLKYKDLKPAFLLLASVGTISEIAKSCPKEAVVLLDLLRDREKAVNKASFRRKINTSSNLRFETLVDILCACGLDPTSFKDERSFINDELCDPRNEIAHGVGGAPPSDLIIKRRDRAFLLMAKLETLFVNAAVNEDYRS